MGIFILQPKGSVHLHFAKCGTWSKLQQWGSALQTHRYLLACAIQQIFQIISWKQMHWGFQIGMTCQNRTTGVGVRSFLMPKNTEKKVATLFQKPKSFLCFAYYTLHAILHHGMSYTVEKLHIRAFRWYMYFLCRCNLRGENRDWIDLANYQSSP